jgi:DNA-binding transcriptional regulator LsrR (DeoR family)
MEKIKIVKSQIKSEIENGMTRKELSEKYNLSTSNINKALKQLGLDKMRATTVKFEVEDDEVPFVETITAEPLNNVVSSEANIGGFLGIKPTSWE